MVPTPMYTVLRMATDLRILCTDQSDDTAPERIIGIKAYCMMVMTVIYMLMSSLLQP